MFIFFFFFQAEDGIRDLTVTGVQTCALPILWPGQDAVGKRISMQDDPGPNDWLTVVGVVNDVVQDEQLTRHSTIYLPYLQTTSPGFINHMTYVVRPAPAANVAPAMRAALRDVDRVVPAQALQTMDQSMLDTIAEPVFQMRLLTGFALLALLLAALGTYGVLAYDVTERTREIGLRLALGATPGNVLRMVLWRTAALALAGALLGLGGALVLTRVLTKSLFEVKPTDPVTLVAVTVVLVLVALVAGFFPAQRATPVPAPLGVLPDLPSKNASPIEPSWRCTRSRRRCHPAPPPPGC